MLVISSLAWSDWRLHFTTAFKVNQNVVAFDVVVGYIVRLDDFKCFKHFFVNGQIQTQIVHNVCLLTETPLT